MNIDIEMDLGPYPRDVLSVLLGGMTAIHHMK